MGLAVGNAILAAEFNAIKARVKAECSRRKYVGSVEDFASAAYDYSVIPGAGNPVLTEHWNKIIVPMNQIMDTGYDTASVGDPVLALDTISVQLATLEAEAVDGQKSSCRSTCTGLCVGACTSGCMGCTGGCASTCSQSCTGGCSGCSSCSGSCVGGCRTEACKGGCSTEGCKGAQCRTNCSAFCTNNTRIADN